MTTQDNYKLERKLRTTPYSENQTIELTRRNERKPMFKSLKAPYQHSDLTQHYLGIEYQSAKEACKDNQLTPWQPRLWIPNDVCTCREHTTATCMAQSSWWSISKLDNYRCMTWWRGSAPRDLAPATNCRDIHPSMHRQNQSTQSRHIDMKARTGWTEVRCSTTPSGVERTKVVKHSCLTKDSKYSLHERRTHTQGGCILTKRDSYIEGLHGYLYNDEKYAKSWHLIWVLTTIPKVLFTFG